LAKGRIPRPSSGEAAAARGDRASLVGAQTKVLELPTPQDVGVTKAFDIDAARETSLDGGLDEPRSQGDELRRVVGFSVADEITKLDQLRQSGSITDFEYGRLRTKLVQ